MKKLRRGQKSEIVDERMQHEERQTQQMMFSSFMGQINHLLMSQYPMPRMPQRIIPSTYLPHQVVLQLVTSMKMIVTLLLQAQLITS